MIQRNEQLVIVRGGGDIATGTISRLFHSGYPVVILEIAAPSAIRRQVALSEAVYDGESKVEDVTCVKVDSWEAAQAVLKEKKKVPLLVDPDCDILNQVRPWALVDAILAKKNLGTNRQMADKTVALGPGFSAGEDVDLVVETQRGHNLGRIIKEGPAAPNSGTPGIIGGYGKERVIHSPAEGRLYGKVKISDRVEKGQTIAVIRTANGEEVKVEATLTGLVRGLIRDGYPVTVGFKIADIDPRESEFKNCFTISDKARNVSGGVLEALLYLEEKQGY